MGRRLVAGMALALAVPGLALAAKPPSPGHGPHSPGNAKDGHGKSVPQVMYVLKGTLSNYTPAGATTGTITITISHANRNAKTLVNARSPLSVTILVSWDTRVVMHGNATTIADGDSGLVKVRLPKNTLAVDLTRALMTLPTVAAQVIDQGQGH
jgi:hypothetical protein